MIAASIPTPQERWKIHGVGRGRDYAIKFSHPQIARGKTIVSPAINRDGEYYLDAMRPITFSSYYGRSGATGTPPTIFTATCTSCGRVRLLSSPQQDGLCSECSPIIQLIRSDNTLIVRGKSTDKLILASMREGGSVQSDSSPYGAMLYLIHVLLGSNCQVATYGNGQPTVVSYMFIVKRQRGCATYQATSDDIKIISKEYTTQILARYESETRFPGIMAFVVYGNSTPTAARPSPSINNPALPAAYDAKTRTVYMIDDAEKTFATAYILPEFASYFSPVNWNIVAR